MPPCLDPCGLLEPLFLKEPWPSRHSLPLLRSFHVSDRPSPFTVFLGEFSLFLSTIRYPLCDRRAPPLLSASRRSEQSHAVGANSRRSAARVCPEYHERSKVFVGRFWRDPSYVLIPLSFPASIPQRPCRSGPPSLGR